MWFLVLLLLVSLALLPSATPSGMEVSCCCCCLLLLVMLRRC
jgi:hypothetical protein